MKINVNQTLKALNGDVLKDNDGQGNAKDANVKDAIINVLLASIQQGKTETGVDKVKKYELAKRIYETDEVLLSVEEIVLIKDRVGDSFGPMVVGQVFKLLEGKE